MSVRERLPPSTGEIEKLRVTLDREFRKLGRCVPVPEPAPRPGGGGGGRACSRASPTPPTPPPALRNGTETPAPPTPCHFGPVQFGQVEPVWTGGWLLAAEHCDGRCRILRRSGTREEPRARVGAEELGQTGCSSRYPRSAFPEFADYRKRRTVPPRRASEQVSGGLPLRWARE